MEMKDNNHFESFLRDKLAEKAFPYDEAYWDQAQQQFAEWDQKKKRHRALLWIFAGLLLCTIGGWTLGQFLNPTPHVEELSSIHAELTEETSPEDLSMCADIPFSSVDMPDLPDPNHESPSSSLVSQTSLPTDLHSSTKESAIPATVLEEERMEPSSQFVPTETTISAASISEKQSKQTISIQDIDNQKLLLFPLHERFPEPTELQGIRPHGLRWYIQAGLAVSQSQHLDTSYTTLTLSPLIETGVVIPTQAGIDLSVGLNYFSTPLLNTSATMIYRSYDFIVREEEKVWTPEHLHFAGVHVGASSRLGARHEIGLDTRINYLLTTQGTLGETRRTTFESTADEPQTVWHYRNSLRSWDIQTGLFHQYHFTPRLSVKTAVYHGFRNLTQDAGFTPAVKHRNSRLSLSLIYWLR